MKQSVGVQRGEWMHVPGHIRGSLSRNRKLVMTIFGEREDSDNGKRDRKCLG